MAETVLPDKSPLPGGDPNSPAGDLLSVAKRRFANSEDSESELRMAMLDDLKFRSGNQWDQRLARRRMQAQRPTLVINRVPEFLRQVTNYQRRSRPGIRVAPVANGATVDSANIIQDIIRHIEYRSKADVVYATACEHQVTMGRGWIRAHVDFTSEYEFSREILYDRVEDPFTIYPDPMARELDYSDMRYCFVAKMIPMEEFRLEYPNASIQSWAGKTDRRAQDSQWVTERSVRVAEYWWIDPVKDTLIEYSHPTFPHTLVLLKSLAEGEMAEAVEGWEPGRSRPVIRKQVKWALINGVEILKGNDQKTDGALWPGTEIPIVPVLGEEINIEGKTDLRGMVRDAKDPQRVYNFMVSNAAETVSLAPRAPFLVSADQIEGHQRQWKQMNWMNYPYLLYNAQTKEGQPIPPPQRNVQEPPIQGMILAIQQFDSDLKSVTGFHEPSIGERSHERSAKAIELLQERGERGSSHFMDNLAVALRRLGQVTVDLIPSTYTERQVLRILNERDKPRSVMVGRGVTQADKKRGGVDEVLDPTFGVYEITTDLGPSYQTRRKQILEQLTQFVTAYPETFKLIGDLIVRHMDHPMAKEVADRLFMALPPEFQEEPPPDTPPEAHAIIQSMAHRLRLAQQQTQELQREIDTGQPKLDADLMKTQMETASREHVAAMTASVKADSEERISAAENAVKMAVEEMKAANQAAAEEQKAENQRAADERKADMQREAEGRKAESEARKEEDTRRTKDMEAAITRETESGRMAMELIKLLFQDNQQAQEHIQRTLDRGAAAETEKLRAQTQKDVAAQRGQPPAGGGGGQARA